MLVNLLLKNESSERTFLTNDIIKIGNIMQYYLETFNICYLDNTQNLPIVFKRNRNDNEFIILSSDILNDSLKRLIRTSNDENVICQLELPMINKINYWQGYINFISNNLVMNEGLIHMSHISNGSIRFVGRTQYETIRNVSQPSGVNIDTIGNSLRRSNLRLNTEPSNLSRLNVEPQNRFESYFTNQTEFNPTNILNTFTSQPQTQPRMEFQFLRSNGFGGLIRNLISNISNISNIGADIRVVLSEETFNTLRKCKYQELELNLKEMNIMCNLTLQNFSPNNDVVVLPCNHVFNYEPIKEWLTNHSNKCPICRREIDGQRRYLNENNDGIYEYFE